MYNDVVIIYSVESNSGNMLRNKYICLKFSIPKCYNKQINTIRQSITQLCFIYNGIYVRATCFDLFGHPQALQEHRSKRCSAFLHCGIPNAHKFRLQKQKRIDYINLTCYVAVLT